MKKIRLLGGILFFVLALFSLENAAYAKEVPPDGNIPLTSEYFPDEWFLKSMVRYDKNKDGCLSPEEIEAVTFLSFAMDLTDFSQVQYFTNVRDLRMECANEEYDDEVWIGTDIDLTVFPDLENVLLCLDSRRAPAGSPMVQIRVSGLKHLKSILVSDVVSPSEHPFDGSDVNIEAIDLRDTPALETVKIYDAAGVVFDDQNRIREIDILNMKEIPYNQIERFENLERLKIWANREDFYALDVSGCKSLKRVEIENSWFQTLVTAGADKLEEICLTSDVLESVDVSQNRMLKDLRLEGQISAIDLRQNTALEEFSICSDKLNTLDVSRNAKLTGLYVKSDSIKKLNIKKNRRLKNLSVKCGKISSLNLTANKKLVSLAISGTPLRTLDLSKHKELTHLFFTDNKKLAKLDLSKNTLLGYLKIANTFVKSINVPEKAKISRLEVTGNKKLTKLDLSKNKRLSHVDLRNNALKTLKLGAKAKISSLYCSKNKLTVLHVPALPYLSELDCSKNKLTTLDLSKAAALQELVCDKKVKVKGYKGTITRV